MPLPLPKNDSSSSIDLKKVAEMSNTLKWRLFFLAKILEYDIDSLYLVIRGVNIAYIKKQEEEAVATAMQTMGVQNATIRILLPPNVNVWYPAIVSFAKMKEDLSKLMGKLKISLDKLDEEITWVHKEYLELHEMLTSIKRRVLVSVYKQGNGNSTETKLSQCKVALIDVRAMQEVMSAILDITEDGVFNCYPKFASEAVLNTSNQTFDQVISAFTNLRQHSEFYRRKVVATPFSHIGIAKIYLQKMRSTVEEQVKRLKNLITSHSDFNSQLTYDLLDVNACKELKEIIKNYQ